MTNENIRRKEKVIARLKKFEEKAEKRLGNFRIPFEKLKKQVLEYFDQTGKSALKRGRLTIEFKDWVYHNTPRFTIDRPP